MYLSICPRFPSFLAASPGTELLGWQFMAGSPSSVCCPGSLLTLPGVQSREGLNLNIDSSILSESYRGLKGRYYSFLFEEGCNYGSFFSLQKAATTFTIEESVKDQYRSSEKAVVAVFFMYGTSKDSHISGFPKVSMSILRLSVVEAAGLAGLPGSVLSIGSGVRASLLHAGTSRQHNTTSGSERECRQIYCLNV